MKELSHLSARDLELLSGYLDGELIARDHARLLLRLEREPGLRQALEELRAVTQQLGSIPDVPLPRSFTLTPEAAGIRPRQRIYPIFQLATVLAAIAFVAVVGLDAITSQISMASRAPALSMAVEEAQELAPQADAESSAGESLGQTDGMWDGTAARAEEEVEGAPALPAAEVPAEADEARCTDPMPSPEPLAEKAVGAETIAGEGAADEMTAPSLSDDLAATPLAESLNAIVETLESDIAAPGDMDVGYAQESPRFWSPASIPFFRIVEMGLGSLLLILGAITLWIRSKRV